MNSRVDFHLLIEGHLPDILEIEKATNTAPWSERSFRNELDHPHGIFISALLDGKVVGYAGVWLVIDEAHVTTITVREDMRGKGLGRRLMEDLLKRARDAGMLCSTLECRASNEIAIRLYEGLGYVATARRAGYYPDNHEDAVVMWLHDLQNWTPGS